jgi:hypothetical protein
MRLSTFYLLIGVVFFLWIGGIVLPLAASSHRAGDDWITAFKRAFWAFWKVDLHR